MKQQSQQSNQYLGTQFKPKLVSHPSPNPILDNTNNFEFPQTCSNNNDEFRGNRPLKRQIMIRSFSYKKVETDKFLSSATTQSKNAKNIKFNSNIDPQQHGEEGQEEFKKNNNLESSPKQKLITQESLTNRFPGDNDSRPTTNSAMRTYFHTLSGTMAPASKAFTFASTVNSNLNYNNINPNRNSSSQSQRRQQLQQSLHKSQNKNFNNTQNNFNSQKKNQFLSSKGFLAKDKMKQRMSQTSQQDGFILTKQKTIDFYDSYFEQGFRGDDMGGIQTDRDDKSLSQKPKSFNQLNILEDVPDVLYKTNQDFKNCGSNKHLFFLNFMHDQKNPPKIQPNIQIPSEEEINNTYKFKLPQLLAQHENPKCQINFLNAGWDKDVVLIHQIIEQAQRMNKELVEETLGLKKDIRNIKDKYNKELQNIEKEYQQKMKAIPEKIQADFVSHQTEQFRLNKEITRLNKDKRDLETAIDNTKNKIASIETKMFGFPIFELEANDKDLDHIQEMNIRNDIQAYSITEYQDLIH